MVAAYPPRIETQPVKRDFIDPIWARHFNLMQDEVRAVQQTLGVNPHIAVADPAGRTPNYGTVTSRIRSMARGEPMCSYRGRALGVSVKPNQHVRPALIASEDTHQAATETGYRLPQTGYWVIHAKVDWTSTLATQANPTIRAVGIELDAADYGLADSVIETADNRENLTTHIFWQERLLSGTDISLNLRAANTDTSLNTMPAHVYLRVYLVRCMDEGEIVGLPVVGFTPEPPPAKKSPKPGTWTTTPQSAPEPYSPPVPDDLKLSPSRVHTAWDGDPNNEWPHRAGSGLWF